MIEAWDHVNGGSLPIEEKLEARHGEIEFMQDKRLRGIKPVSECWEKTRRAPISVR